MCEHRGAFLTYSLLILTIFVTSEYISLDLSFTNYPGSIPTYKSAASFPSHLIGLFF